MHGAKYEVRRTDPAVPRRLSSFIVHPSSLLIVAAIAIAGCPRDLPPTASFAGTPLAGHAPLAVQFTDHSDPGAMAITAWQWDFGDGTASEEPNPQHSYAATGHFTVTLTVTSPIGADTLVATDYIAVTEAGEPTPHTYYVSQSGNDANDGSLAHPWRTPGHGSKQLHAGDTLVIMAGEYVISTYYDDMITFEASGAPDAWITVQGEAGTRPILKGRNGLLAAIEFNNKSYIQIKNLVIASDIDVPYSGGFRGGIDAGGSAGGGSVSYLVFRDIEIRHVEEGAINLSGNTAHATLEGLNIHHVGGTGIGAPGADGGRGWEFVALSNSLVRYAGYFAHGQEQISDWERPDGIGMEASEGPLEIRNCIFEHNRGDGLDSKSKRTYVHETIIANNTSDSLKFWGDGSKAENVLIYGDGDTDPSAGSWASIVIDTGSPGHFEFVNVTVDDNAARNNYPIYMQYDIPVPISVTMRNCIVAHGSNVIYLGNAVTLTADHCDFHRNGDPDEAVIHVNGDDLLPSQIPSLGPGMISDEPQFVRRAWGTSGDYHLQPTSPGIDAGSATGAPGIDLDGITRPQGAGHDLGAYER